jgi:hypothetical protein
VNCGYKGQITSGVFIGSFFVSPTGPVSSDMTHARLYMY